jgi:hypothetical protein
LQTVTYIDWPEFILEGGAALTPDHGEPRLYNGVAQGTTSPAGTITSVVLSPMIEWETWIKTHTPGNGQPATTAGWYDLRLADGEIIDVVPIYRVDSSLGDLGAYVPVGASGSGTISYWIRYVFRFRWSRASRTWTAVDYREYTTATGERILFPRSGAFLADGWDTVGKAVITSHKALLQSQSTAYATQKATLTGALASVRDALKAGVYTTFAPA